MNHIRECRKCSHFYHVTMPHACPHGWGVVCNHCERTRKVGRNRRNRRLFPSAKAMWESGVSCRCISEELGIGYATVKRWKRGASPFNILRVYQSRGPAVSRRSTFQPPLIPMPSRWTRWRA